jgi:hypothetical protein
MPPVVRKIVVISRLKGLIQNSSRMIETDCSIEVCFGTFPDILYVDRCTVIPGLDSNV